MHLFEHPDCAEVLPILFKMIPKKLDEHIRQDSSKGPSTGWGLCFVEGINYSAVFMLGCVGFILCTFVAGIWSFVADDVQAGFGVGAFLLTIMVFCVGNLYTSLL